MSAKAATPDHAVMLHDHQHRSARSVSAGALYFAAIAVPAMVFYFGLSESNTVGLMLVAMWVLARPWPRQQIPQGLRAVGQMRRLHVTLGIVLVLVLHLLASAFVRPIDVPRAIGSLVPLTLLLLAGGVLANVLLGVSAGRLHRGLLRCFLALCVLALVGATGWGPPTLAIPWRKPVFPFSEPSVFALAFIPLLMYACVSTSGSTRIVFVMFGLACSAFIQNLTLAVGCVLVAVVALRTTLLFALSLPAIYALSRLDLSYFVERLDFSGDGQNLSNLFYLQGWQMVWESLERSSGIGIGFQQLGMHGTDVAAAEVLAGLYGGEDVNVLGTLFIFARLGGEFGVLGFLLTLGYMVMAVRAMFGLRRVAVYGQRVAPVVTFARCVVVSFLIEIFVRSAGYFTGTGLILAASLWILRQHRAMVR